MRQKQCSKCGLVKELGEFHLDKKSPDGHRRDCRDCRNATSKRRKRHIVAPVDLRRERQLTVMVPAQMMRQIKIKAVLADTTVRELVLGQLETLLLMDSNK